MLCIRIIKIHEYSKVRESMINDFGNVWQDCQIGEDYVEFFPKTDSVSVDWV